MKKIIFILPLIALMAACSKESNKTHYFEVGIKTFGSKTQNPDWRDSSFVIAISDPGILSAAYAELNKPVSERIPVYGGLRWGNGSFNHNANFQFNWHLDGNTIKFVDLSAEIFDGRPYSDVNLNRSTGSIPLRYSVHGIPI